MRARIFLQIIILCFCALSWADDTYLKYDEIQWSQKDPAFLDVIDTLSTLKANSTLEDTSSEFRTFEFRESIYHISKLRKAKTTLVFIHGLYGGADQFNSFFKSMKKNGSDANAILLTLPGHYKKGNYNKPVKVAKKKDWIAAVHQTLKLAKAISDKVVVIGQSTGGLLAVYSAINFSNLIDGAILLEPALKVQTRIDIATCLGKHIAKEASSLSFIAKLIGMDAPKGISVSMGCEAAKLASQLLDRKLINISLFEESQNMKEEPLEEAMSRLAGQIHIPVLMVNNVSDHVVDPRYNKMFANLLKSKMYLEINKDGKTLHGSSETLKPNYKNNAFYQYACDFLFQKFAERNCTQIYYQEKIRPYRYPVSPSMSEQEIEKSFAKINDDQVSEVICKIIEKNFSEDKLCLQFKAMIQFHIQYWQNVWESYKANPNGHKSFGPFFTQRIEQYSNDERARIQKFDDSADYFKALLEGVYYYDLGYIYALDYKKYQSRLAFMSDLEREKDWLENSGALLKGIFSDEAQRNRLADNLRDKIPGVGCSDIYGALRLIEKSHQINEEIVAQKTYLSRLSKYLKRVDEAKTQRVVDPTELDYIMKNHDKLPDESSFQYSFDIQKVKAVFSYLLEP